MYFIYIYLKRKYNQSFLEFLSVLALIPSFDHFNHSNLLYGYSGRNSLKLCLFKDIKMQNKWGSLKLGIIFIDILLICVN